MRSTSRPWIRPDLVLLLELLEQVGEALVVHGLGQLPALGQREAAHGGGHVGRVHVPVGPELDGHVPRVPHAGDLVPGDDPRRSVPAERTPGAEGDGGHLPGHRLALGGAEGEVVDDLATGELAVEQRPGEELAWAELEGAEVDGRALEADAELVELAHPSDAHEDPAALDGGDEAEHTGCDRPVRRDEHDVVDPSDRRAVGIEERQPHDPRCVDERRRHARRLREGRHRAISPACPTSAGRRPPGWSA
jgi:hypothetical protein